MNNQETASLTQANISEATRCDTHTVTSCRNCRKEAWVGQAIQASFKGANDPVVPWPDQLIVVDPAPIIAAAERLERKGGREAMARCPTREDAASAWLIDRFSRLCPDLTVRTEVASTGGQYLVSLHHCVLPDVLAETVL